MQVCIVYPEESISGGRMFTVITMMRSGLTDRSSRVRSVVSVVTPARCYKDDNLTPVISITNTANIRTNCIVTRLVIRVYLGVDK